MSSDQSNQTSTTPAGGGGRRRSSFVDLFGPRSPNSGQPGATQPRRLSISTLGLSTMPGSQTSPFNNVRGRTESVSSTNSGSVDESPFEDEPGPLPSGSVPTSPFARRMSFGAKAMRDIRGGGVNGNGNLNGRASVSSTTSPNATAPATATAAAAATATAAPGSARRTSPTLKSREGFDFAENLRARAERSSISSGSSMPPGFQQPHQRAKSITTMEVPKTEMPKERKAPDAFQERILKGDFYMD